MHAFCFSISTAGIDVRTQLSTGGVQYGFRDRGARVRVKGGPEFVPQWTGGTNANVHNGTLRKRAQSSE